MIYIVNCAYLKYTKYFINIEFFKLHFQIFLNNMPLKYSSIFKTWSARILNGKLSNNLTTKKFHTENS